MLKYKALIFDVDGTLTDNERQGHRVAFNAAFQRAGLDWVWDESLYGALLKTPGGKERIEAFATRWRPAWPASGTRTEAIAALHRQKTQMYGDMLAQGLLRLRPGVAEVVRAAHAAGVALAIATTTTRVNVDLLLKYSCPADLAGVFSVISAAEDAAAKKPSPDVYLNALGRLGVPGADALAIEDTEIGLKAACGAGMDCLITWNDYTRDENFAGAAAVVKNLTEAAFTFENGAVSLLESRAKLVQPT